MHCITTGMRRRKAPNDYVKEKGIPCITGTYDGSKVTQYHLFFWCHPKAGAHTALEDSAFAFNTATSSYLKDTICSRGIATTTRSEKGVGSLGVLNYPAEVFKALEALVPQYWKVEDGQVDIRVTKQKMKRKECPPLLLGETEGDADKVASMQSVNDYANQVFDLTFSPEVYYNFVLHSGRPGGDFRDLNSEGFIFRANRMHIKDDTLDRLPEGENLVWNLKVAPEARFMPNSAARTAFTGVVEMDATPTEDSEELHINNRSYRWSSYQREILSDQGPIKQKMFVIDTAGCELVNECNPDYVPPANGKKVKAVKTRYANGSKMTLDTSQLKPRDARTLFETLTSDSENPLTWTNVTRKESERPEWSNQECRWPVDFNPDPNATKVVQREGQLLIAVQSAPEE